MQKLAFFVISLALVLVACARGSSTDDAYEDGTDAGFVRPGDDDGSGSKDASIDGSADAEGPSDSGAEDDSGDPAKSCEGKTCDDPPANACADADNLRVHEAAGTCDEAGECQYASATKACPGGCKSGACVDDPCVGIACHTRPQSRCKDESYLTVFDLPGSCQDGACEYESHEEFCAFGCANDICNGNPCEGVVCDEPFANYCSGPTTLFVYQPTGTCSPKTGQCSYEKLRDEHCASGCEAGKCKNDPCVGVTCNKPPARDCKDPNTARTYASSGTCANGLCTYQEVLSSCPYGCASGSCKDCSADADCGSGRWCDGSTCKSCNSDQRCGASCENCAASGKKCSSGRCVECTIDSQCGPGKRCQANSCVACDTNNACGASCSPCQAGTFCNGSQCICDATSCGAGSYCLGTSCSPCNVPASCGPLCQSCSATTPICGGPSVGCQCTESSCGPGSFCGTSGQCESCGPQACGNGRCDCGETQASCPSDCGAPCPLGMVIGEWGSGDDGWGRDGLWRRESGAMVAGSSLKYSSSYTQNLTYGANIDLRSCGQATLSFRVRLDDDYSSSYSEENDKTDKSERLYVQCSGDGGANYTNMTPSPWPANQSACGDSYCAGKYGLNRGFPWTAQTLAIPASCLTRSARFRFQAKGANVWRLQNPGWYVDDVTVN